MASRPTMSQSHVRPSLSPAGSPGSSILSPSPTPSTNLVPLKTFSMDESESKPSNSRRLLRSRKRVILLIVGIAIMLLTTLTVTLVLVLERRGASAHTHGYLEGNLNEPIVDLDYAKYMGVPGGHNVTSWLGIRYAAPPLGKLRFAAPQDPEKESGIQRAHDRGPYCIPTIIVPNSRVSEDCLRLNVFAPSGAQADSKLPVFFFILGGGYDINSDPYLNGTGLISASGQNMIVVTFTYRVSLYGFLPGKEVEKGGSLNNGLKDQIKALQWVQKHISKFGGDPNHVVIGGHSAGAASVAHLLTAHGGRDDGLFHGAIAGSPSFGTTLTNKESQYLYNGLIKRTGCDTESDTLACLRELDVAKLKAHNVGLPLPGSTGPPLFPYSPVVDGDLIQDTFYNLFNAGKIIDVPTVLGSDSDEGTIFAPHDIPSQEAADKWLSRQFPALKSENFQKIHSLYPMSDVQYSGASEYWKSLSNVYGEMRYICPAMYICRTMSKKFTTNTWNYEYGALDPRHNSHGYGAAHTAELNAIFGPQFLGRQPLATYTEPTNAPIVPVVQGYWTSFIRSLDPNKYRASGSPEWKTSLPADSSGSIHRMFFYTNATRMIVEDEDLKERCDYLTSIGTVLKQ